MITAYRRIKGELAFVEIPVALELLEEFPVGKYIVDRINEKFSHLEKSRCPSDSPQSP
jgi:hypothetical protein